VEHLKITQDISSLNLDLIRPNLFKYSYRTKNLKNININNIDQSSPFYISYSSLKGEIYENIIYEHLLFYAVSSKDITKFILKGIHQNFKVNQAIKSGMNINRHNQIVYKAAYKDITEYDAMFFTKDSIYFVEMSIAKKTSSLNKRLDKKYSLLKILFPKLTIRCLVVLTNGSLGISKFPSYATIWLTKDFDDKELLQDIISSPKDITRANTIYNSKFIQVKNLHYTNFIYFKILQWLLNKSKLPNSKDLDITFLKSDIANIYFDIYSKFYIGYITIDEFNHIYSNHNLKSKDDYIFVTLEKVNRKKFEIVYYILYESYELQRIILENSSIDFKDKDPKGFTKAEVKFIRNIFKPQDNLSYKNIVNIEKSILQLYIK
jgi:hypothetical protein